MNYRLLQQLTFFLLLILSGVANSDSDMEGLSISADLGWQNDDNVTTAATDNSSGASDDSLVFNLGVSKSIDLDDSELEVSYDYSRTDYDSLTAFDLESNSVSASWSKEVKSVNLLGLYMYSSTRLGGSDFLDLQNVYLSAGKLIEGTKWYLNPALNYQNKDFATANTNDADQYAFDLMSLYLGGENKIKLSYRYEYEDTVSSELDYRANIFSASYKTNISLGETKANFEISHKFTDKNFINETAAISADRKDEKNLTDIKLSYPLDENMSLDFAYSYLDANSNLSTSSYSQNIYGLSIAYKM